MKINKLKSSFLMSIVMIPLMALAAFAQWGGTQYPNSDIACFRWEGIVDGTTFVYVRGRQVQVETRSGLPVQRQRYNFTDPLPRTPVRISLNHFNGRGQVRLVEVPRSSNDFTAIVRIDDNYGGQDAYGFELLWNDRTRNDNWGGWSGNNPQNMEFVRWRGRVDGEAIIRFRGNQAWDETQSGRGVWNTQYRFSDPLPQRPVVVNLLDTDGRGEVNILEQPNRNNNYTVTVQVRDRRGGSDEYGFHLGWERRRFNDNDGEFPGGNRNAGLRWSGRVDGRDLIYIRGNRLWINHREGQEITGADYRFFQPLTFDRTTIFVRKLRGRGTVRVIEQPTRNNNYTAVLMVEDPEGGADRYEIEVVW
jgi:hypothetical protein